ncbi:hypothetical protein MLD38_010771 [Melastoma candidum]|uniref:Uncharacterized protein n=1 Tax=Melastoma candidum TaxID=119954 RepID=A0ACB9R0E6_9MYRT|nr:hypothetical protein MLD38_010771 [Melastoma candidum]
MALLDTRFIEYQHACIGTIETTLNVETVFVTLYPNFCMSLQDPKLLIALQVRIQIAEPQQDPNSIEATLHYQMPYRVQNHALDLKVPDEANDALIITADYHHVKSPTCLHVPRQISRNELLKLLPEKWVTNYEQLQEHVKPIQSSESRFIKEKDGSVTIKFDKTHEKDAATPSIFPTTFMIQPVPRSKKPDSLNKIIHSFDGQGKEIYFFKDPQTEHCYWDVGKCRKHCDCYEEPDEDDYSSRKKKNHRSRNLPESDSDSDDDDDSNQKPSVVVTEAPHQGNYGDWQYLVDMAKTKRPAKQPTKVLPCYKNILKWQRKNPSEQVVPIKII